VPGIEAYNKNDSRAGLGVGQGKSRCSVPRSMLQDWKAGVEGIPLTGQRPRIHALCELNILELVAIAGGPRIADWPGTQNAATHRVLLPLGSVHKSLPNESDGRVFAT